MNGVRLVFVGLGTDGCDMLLFQTLLWWPVRVLFLERKQSFFKNNKIDIKFWMFCLNRKMKIKKKKSYTGC